MKLESGIQGRLATEGWQYGVRSFLRDDRFDYLWGNWLNIGGVSEVGVSHDCGGV